MSPAVGVDLGGTKIAAGLVDDDGVVRAEARRETPSTPDGVVAAIVELVHELDARAAPVGIGAAGFVDASRRSVLFAPNLHWVDVPLARLVAAAVDGPVVLENDANAAAWGEARFGAGIGVGSLVLVTVGTGIGGGVVLDGALVRGGFGVAGEFGHLPVVHDGLPCPCGQRGCWEQYASGTALSRAVHERLGDVDAADVLRAGDRTALACLDETARWLGTGLAALAALLDPELIVIGGGVIENGDRLLDPARSEFRRRLPAGDHRPVAEIRAARLGPAAGMVGAADLARRAAI